MQQTIDSILQAMKSGRHAEALAASHTLAQSFPADEGVLSLLAVSEQNAGDLLAARGLLVTLTRDHPGTWQHWNNLGNVERLLGDLEGARIAYARALQINSGSARLRANLGLLHLNLGEFGLAREYLCSACAMEGSEHGMRVWAAVACQASADDATARSLVEGWRQWPRISEEAMLELGWLLTLLGDIESGELILSGEFQDSTIRARALARRVLALERLNKVAAAADLTRRMPDPTLIADRQARMESLKALAIVAMRQDLPDQAREYLSAALALDQPRRYKRPLYFALANACDALGDIDAAMEALSQAHAGDVSAQIERESSGLTGTGLLGLAEDSHALSSTPQWSAESAPSMAESPVFIVGFPRSGTTLLEQMLSAHEAFASADEQPMVQRMLEYLREQGVSYPAGLSALSDAQRSALRDRYWAESRRTVTLGDGVRLVDKHPLNFLALPLIRFVFPHAPVIFCRRHPCDAILSSYMQDFRDPRLAIECASIERLAKLFVRLAERWKHDSALFPTDILVCRHEDVINDTDRELQRIGEFVGVADISAMREYQDHAQARGFIGTPSYAQVVQGINPDAAGRWKRYSRYLEHILPELAPIMDDWGYEA